jgi:hypothetical protein
MRREQFIGGSELLSGENNWTTGEKAVTVKQQRFNQDSSREALALLEWDFWLAPAKI